MRLRRTHILATGLAALSVVALAACSGTSAASTSSTSDASAVPLKFGLNYVATVEHYAPYYALTEGLFSKAGLDVTVTPGGDTPGTTLLAAGQLDVAVSDTTTLIQAADKGQNFVAIATEYQMSPTSMTCRQDSGVTKISDLKGKKLGTKPTVSDYLPLIYTAAGITASDLTIVPIGAQDITGIISGQVDCMFSTFAFNEPRSIEAAGVPVNVFPLAEFGLPSQGDVYVTTQAILDDPAKKAAITKLVGALGEAYSTAIKDPDAAAEYMVDNAFVDGLDIDQQKYQSETQVSYISTDYTKANGLMALDPDAWSKSAAALFSLGLTSKLVDTTPLLDDLTAAAGTPKE